MRKFLLSFFTLGLLVSFIKASAQSADPLKDGFRPTAERQTRQGGDTIVLISGKKINAHILEIRETSIRYRVGTDLNGKIRSIDPYRVFAINKSDGSEQVIFKPDTIDEPDFNVSQLRLFIKGEQDARAGYHNTLNKAAAFAVGAGSSFFSIYGLVGPAIYSSIAGSVSPDVIKQRNADPSLVNVSEYQEGYLTLVRNRKIRNSYLAGMIGFVAGFTAQTIIGNNTKK